MFPHNLLNAVLPEIDYVPSPDRVYAGMLYAQTDGETLGNVDEAVCWLVSDDDDDDAAADADADA